MDQTNLESELNFKIVPAYTGLRYMRVLKNKQKLKNEVSNPM